MLVLSRKALERIIIGDEIVITVLETRGSKVRLGIEAPASVRIDREETAQRRKEAERCSMSSSTLPSV